MDNCIFCKIVKGEVSSELVSKTDVTIAFQDANPSADTHILIVPKKHIEDIMKIRDDDKDVVFEMIKEAQKLVKKMSLGKFRLVFNGGTLLEVKHLHLHLQGGNFKNK